MKYDITNIRKGMLVAVESRPSRNGRGREWLAVCDCGGTTLVRYSNFVAGRHSSCGCRGIEEPSVGEVFGRWTVQEKVRINGRKKFRCRCECGNLGTPTASELRGGRSKMCVSCGHKANIKFGRSARNRLYKSYRQNAISRGLENDLTNEDMDRLFAGDCHYCGDKPSQTISTAGGYIVYNGIDRKNNNLGYTVDNCVSCCAICNRAKREIGYKDFLEWAERLATRALTRQ